MRAVKTPSVYFQGLAASVLMGGISSAAIIVSDDFGDTAHPGNLPGTATSPAIPFIIPSGGTTFAGNATIPNNPTFGRVLQLADSDSSAGTTTAAVGVLPGTAYLTNTGDKVSVTLDFRFTSTTGVETFRVGLFNSSGTSAAGTGSDDDIGYYLNIPAAGAATNAIFFRENSGTSPAMGGTDRTNYVASATLNALPTLAASQLYTLTYTLTRTATGIDLVMGIAVGGSTATTYTASATTSLITSFDEVMFNSAFNGTGQTTLIIDNLVVDATNFVPIPEPSAALLAGAGAVFFLRRRR